jgi:hypothetical protein
VNVAGKGGEVLRLRVSLCIDGSYDFNLGIPFDDYFGPVTD